VHIEIDGELPENQKPLQHDNDSFITVELLPLNTFLQALDEYAKENFLVDANVYSVAFGFEFHKNFKEDKLQIK